MDTDQSIFECSTTTLFQRSKYILMLSLYSYSKPSLSNNDLTLIEIKTESSLTIPVHK